MIARTLRAAYSRSKAPTRVGRCVLFAPLAVLLLWLAAGAILSTPATDVHVRWAPGVTPAQREQLEHKFLLSVPQDLGTRTWAYVMLDVSRSNINGLIDHPAVEDTAGLDRQKRVSLSPSRQATSWLRVIPWIRHPKVAQDATWALLMLSVPALLWIVRRFRRGVALPSWCRPLATAVGMAALMVLGYLTTNRQLTSDDSYSIGIAQSFLRGDRPYIDFFDSGAPLAWWLSVVGQWFSGGLVVGEFAVTMVVQAIGLWLTYRLTRRATELVPLSLVLLAAAAVCTYATQLYGYPKAFVYPMALWGIWWFLDRPDMRRTAVLAVITVIAFLFRHDHGLYVGLGAMAAILSGYATDGVKLTVRRAIAFGAVAVCVLMPLLAVIQTREGVLPYFRDRVQLAQFLGIDNRRPPLTLTALWPPLGAAEPWPATVTVGWREGLPADQIAGLKERFGLRPLPRNAERLALGDTRRENVRALIRHPDVAWVRGVDALTYRPVESPTVFTLRNWLASHSLILFPGRLQPSGSVNALYTILMLTPVAVLLLLLVGRLTRSHEVGVREVQRMVAAAILVLAAHYGLLRTAGRVLDLMPLDAVMIGWLVVRFRWITSGLPVASRGLSWAASIAAAALVAVVCLTAWDVAEANDLLRRSELKEGPAAAARRAAELWRYHTTRPPIDVFSPPGTTTERTLVRYLHECTEPDDRIWEPTSNFATPYYADRGVVEHQWWSSNFRRQPEQQEQTLRWLQRQQVPIVITVGTGSAAEVFRSHHLIYAYLQREYVDVTSEAARASVYTEGRSLEVLVRRDRRPVRLYEGLELPCFTPAR